MRIILIILGVTNLLCGCKQNSNKDLIPNSTTTDTTKIVSNTIIDSISDNSDYDDYDYLGRDIHNTIGFITIIGLDKLDGYPDIAPDTINAIRIINDDNSTWMSFYPDFGYVSEEKKNKTWNKLFRPWALMSGYDVLVMRCVAENDKAYSIIVNEKLGLIRSIEKYPRLQLETIQEHLLHVLLGSDFETNPLRKEPSDKSEIINLKRSNDSDNLIYGSEIKGDWIKLKDQDDNILGWVKWIQNNKLAVQIHYLL